MPFEVWASGESGQVEKVGRCGQVEKVCRQRKKQVEVRPLGFAGLLTEAGARLHQGYITIYASDIHYLISPYILVLYRLVLGH